MRPLGAPTPVLLRFTEFAPTACRFRKGAQTARGLAGSACSTRLAKPIGSMPQTCLQAVRLSRKQFRADVSTAFSLLTLYTIQTYHQLENASTVG